MTSRQSGNKLMEPSKEELNEVLNEEPIASEVISSEKVNAEETLEEEPIKNKFTITEEERKHREENVFNEEKLNQYKAEVESAYQLFKDGKVAMENSYKHMITGLETLAEAVQKVVDEQEKVKF